jgi:hypothetical protein
MTCRVFHQSGPADFRGPEVADKALNSSEQPEKHASGAKARACFIGFFGTTEVMPFQNNSALGVCQQAKARGVPRAFTVR